MKIAFVHQYSSQLEIIEVPNTYQRGPLPKYKNADIAKATNIITGMAVLIR